MSPFTSRHKRADDEQLLAMAGDGDQDAFEALYDRYEKRAFSLAYRIVGTRSLAEEATQEAFISIWKNAARYDEARGSAGGWALGIVRNRAIDLLRKKAGNAPDLDHDDDATLENREAVELTDQAAIRSETRREVKTGLAELPDKQSRVIELAYFGGFSQSEISEMLDEPLGTIKGRMRLGLERLKGSLNEKALEL
jgi:RNA polymerase sigma-70 factor (ECF subfamily)